MQDEFNLQQETPVYRVKLKERFMVLHEEIGKIIHTYLFQVKIKLMEILLLPKMDEREL